MHTNIPRCWTSGAKKQKILTILDRHSTVVSEGKNLFEKNPEERQLIFHDATRRI